MYKFDVSRVFLLFVKIANTEMVAGHYRLFTKNGPVVAHYEQWNPLAAYRFVWTCFIFSVFTQTEGTDSDGPRTEIHWPRLSLSFRDGFHFSLRPAPLYK